MIKSVIENLEAGIAILEALPDDYVSLGRWRECGTIHCAAGWFAISKFFTDQGMETNQYGGPTIKGLTTDHTLNIFFGSTAFDKYFTFRNWGIWDPVFLKKTPHMTDRELAIARLKYGLKKEVAGF